MADTIQLRRDTAANWVAANPVLADGEIGIETDTKKRKCGDGTTAWNSLSYMFSDDLDAEPTANSHKPVESGGVKTAVDEAAEIAVAALDAVGDADDVPTEGSVELVRSGGVWGAIRNNGKGAFDISAYKAVGGVLAKFDNLEQALGTDGANVPVAARQPGMSVCFVLNSDNNYIQARCIADEFTTDVTKWQWVDEEIVACSHNIPESGAVFDALMYGGADEQGVIVATEPYLYPVDGSTPVSESRLSYQQKVYNIPQNAVKVYLQYDNGKSGFIAEQYAAVSFWDESSMVHVALAGSADIITGYETTIPVFEGATKLYAASGFKTVTFITGIPLNEKVVELEDSIEDETERAEGAENVLDGKIEENAIYSESSYTTTPVLTDTISALIKPDGTQTAESRQQYAMKVYTLNGGNRLHLEYHNGKYAFTAPGYIAIAFADNSDNYVQIVRTGEYGGTGDTETIETGYQITVDIPSDAKKLYAVAGFDIIEEYIKDVVTLKEKVHELDNASNFLSYNNLTCVLTLGSSLTQGITCPKYAGWVDRLNNECDILIVNGGHGGYSPKQTLLEVLPDSNIWMSNEFVKFSEIHPSYVMMNNQANNNDTDADELEKVLEKLKDYAESLGAVLLLGDEEVWTAQTYKCLMAYKMFANKYNIPYNAIALNIIAKCYDKGTIPSTWVKQSHLSWRGACAYNAHMDLIDSLPIRKSIKMFRARTVSETVSNLTYTDRLERIKKFIAISSGEGNYDYTYDGDTYKNQFAIADTLSYMQYALPVDGSITHSGGYTETAWMIAGKNIAFTNYCLLEAIFDSVISSFDFRAEVSVEPSNVYILKQSSSSAFTSEFEEVEFDYSNGLLTISKEISNLYRMGRKVSLLIKVSGDFTVAKPYFTYNVVNKQTLREDITFKKREDGTEILSNTNPARSFTLGTDASVISYPTGLTAYSKYNNIEEVVKLVNTGSISLSNISVPSGAKKLMIRIVAQNFIKIATTQYSAENPQYADYVVNDTPAISEGGFDYGAIRLSLTGSTLVVGEGSHTFLVLPGWSELYYEFDLDGNLGTLEMGIERLSYGSYPIHIHNVSIQYK